MNKKFTEDYKKKVQTNLSKQRRLPLEEKISQMRRNLRDGLSGSHSIKPTGQMPDEENPQTQKNYPIDLALPFLMSLSSPI